MWAPGLAIAAGVIGGWFALRGRPLARFGVGLLGIGWVLSSNLVLTIGTILGERLLYLPSAGLCLTVGALALGERGVEAAGGAEAGEGRGRSWGAGAGRCWCCTCSNLPHWSGNRTLAEYAVARGTGERARLQLAQARELMDQGRDEEALEHAERALRIEPTFCGGAGEAGGRCAGGFGRERDGVRDLERAFPGGERPGGGDEGVGGVADAAGGGRAGGGVPAAGAEAGAGVGAVAASLWDVAGGAGGAVVRRVHCWRGTCGRGASGRAVGGDGGAGAGVFGGGGDGEGAGSAGGAERGGAGRAMRRARYWSGWGARG